MIVISNKTQRTNYWNRNKEYKELTNRRAEKLGSLDLTNQKKERKKGPKLTESELNRKTLQHTQNEPEYYKGIFKNPVLHQSEKQK